MEKHYFEEMNSAGSLFYIAYYLVNDKWRVEIYYDGDTIDAVSSFDIPILVSDKYDEETKMSFVEQEISDIVKREIEYL